MIIQVFSRNSYYFLLPQRVSKFLRTPFAGGKHRLCFKALFHLNRTCFLDWPLLEVRSNVTESLPLSVPQLQKRFKVW